MIGDARTTADRSRRAARAGVLLVALAAATLTACGDDGPDAASTGSEPSATSAAGAPATSTPGATTPVTSAGTSAAGTTGDEGGDISAADLDGRTFVATESTGHQLVEDADVVIEFADGSVSGTGGCNSFVATPYSVDGDVLVVAGPMGMTQMACAPAALMDQDAWLAALLTGGPAIELDGDTLTLTGDGDDGLVLRAAG